MTAYNICRYMFMAWIATGCVSTSIECFGQTNTFLKVWGIGRARIRVGFESACQNTGVFERWRTGIQVLVTPSLPYTDLERTCVCGSSAVGYLRKASSLLGHTSFHTLRAVVMLMCWSRALFS
ncbi:hypothetical protein SRHO_G00107150 [Serrasalmus rhombeus]